MRSKPAEAEALAAEALRTMSRLPAEHPDRRRVEARLRIVALAPLTIAR